MANVYAGLNANDRVRLFDELSKRDGYFEQSIKLNQGKVKRPPAPRSKGGKRQRRTRKYKRRRRGIKSRRKHKTSRRK